MLTDEDVRAEYLSAMGPDLGLLCHDLRNEVDWLRDKWSTFQELFEKGSERIDLLSRVASNFFFPFLLRMMYEDAMLHLCRLTDPTETRIRVGKKITVRKNLTVMGLANTISDPGLKARVIGEAAQVKKTCEFARLLRNQRLAHSDLEIFRTKTGSLQLGKDIDDALKSVHALLRSIEEHYHRPLCLLVADPWGAKSLLYYLEKAIQAEEVET